MTISESKGLKDFFKKIVWFLRHNIPLNNDNAGNQHYAQPYNLR